MFLFPVAALLTLLVTSEAQSICAPPVKNSNCLYNAIVPSPDTFNCARKGTLRSPAVLTQYSPCSTKSFEACQSLCMSLTGCISFGFDSSLKATQACTLYTKPLVKMGFTRQPNSKSTIQYWNKHCFSSDCSNLVSNPSFEFQSSQNEPAYWTTTSDTCTLISPSFGSAPGNGSYAFSCLVPGNDDFYLIQQSDLPGLQADASYELSALLRIEWNDNVGSVELQISLQTPGEPFGGSVIYAATYCNPDSVDGDTCSGISDLPSGQARAISSTFQSQDPQQNTLTIDFSFQSSTLSGNHVALDSVTIRQIMS